jgi:RNA polymerase-binding transcription factor DksA
MTKFLTLFELDTTKLPEKPEEQIALYIEQLNMIKEDFKKKNPHMLDWGLFAGTNQGYSVCEGTEQEIDFALLKYGPYVRMCQNPILIPITNAAVNE